MSPQILLSICITNEICHVFRNFALLSTQAIDLENNQTVLYVPMLKAVFFSKRHCLRNLCASLCAIKKASNTNALFIWILS